MNNINLKQNESSSIDLLFAQRYLYTSAKKYFIWRTIIAIFIAIIGPLLTSLNSLISAYVALFVLIYVLADNFLLEKIEISKKVIAAKTQELFDVYVYDMPWNTIVVGEKPEQEVIDFILLNNKNRDSTILMNWYPEENSQVELLKGIFLCQYSNT